MLIAKCYLEIAGLGVRFELFLINGVCNDWFYSFLLMGNRCSLANHYLYDDAVLGVMFWPALMVNSMVCGMLYLGFNGLKVAE